MVFWQVFLLLGCVAFYVNAGVIGSVQGVSVTGRLACGDKSVRDAEVQLWEEDTDKFSSFTSDVFMKFSYSKKNKF